jgi:hypothetical protein
MSAGIASSVAVPNPNQGRELGPGKLFVRLQGGAFEIELE